eukprot:6175158-Pleurochrysis_carterae.AAC.2
MGSCDTVIVLASNCLRERKHARMSSAPAFPYARGRLNVRWPRLCAEEVPDDSFNASATLDDVDLAPSARRVLEELASDLPHILIGEMLVLGASMCAGFRWACTQLLLNPQAATEPRRHTLTAADELGEPDSASQISGDDVRAARTGVSAGVCGVPRGSNGHGSGGGRGGDGSGVGEGSCECVCDGACCDGAREVGDGASYTSDDTDHSAPPPLHPVTLLYYITPFGLLVLLPMAIALESGARRKRRRILRGALHRGTVQSLAEPCRALRKSAGYR